MSNSRGFTLIELMIVVIVVGILAAIALPNFLALQQRAREGATKGNMHTLQLAAEDYGVQNDGIYGAPPDVAALLPGLPPASDFRNPWDKTTGDGNAWVAASAWTTPLATGSSKRGITAYLDSASVRYQIAGRGLEADFAMVLSSGF
jgi:prepilin-type N-terminal cleavage/methylation domain-containing protein